MRNIFKRDKLSMLICLFLFSRMLGQNPTIQTSTIVPAAPTSYYPVKILTSYATIYQSFKISKSFTVSTAQKSIMLTACYWQSGATTVSLQKDTFNIGQLPAGIYTVTFSAIGSFSSNPCVPNTTASKTFTFEVYEDAVAVQQDFIESSGYTYPNPVKDLLYVEIQNIPVEDFEFKLYNALGEIVLRDQLLLESKRTIDMSNYVSGVYFLKIYNSSSQKVVKIIKE